MAATTGEGLKGLNSTTFLCGGKRSQALLSAATVGSKVSGASPTPKRFIVVAATANKSWNPTVKGGGNFIDPEWLDGSSLPNSPISESTTQTPLVTTLTPTSRARCKLGVIIDFSDESAHAVRWVVNHYIRPKDAIIHIIVRRHGWLTESLRISRRACDGHIKMPFCNFHHERRSDFERLIGEAAKNQAAVQMPPTQQPAMQQEKKKRKNTWTLTFYS
ncbi:hypothetical protein ACFX2H_013423 [Malus domestica]